MNMNNNCGCCAPAWTSYLYTVFRIVVGALFFWHGFVKFPGAQGMFLAAGIIELVVGVLLVLGLFTRWAAVLGGLNMIAALVIAHVSKSWVFVGQGNNGGEAALLFLASFLALIAYGSGRLAVQNLFSNCCDCCDSCDSHEHEAPMAAPVVVPARKAPAKKKARR